MGVSWSMQMSLNFISDKRVLLWIIYSVVLSSPLSSQLHQQYFLLINIDVDLQDPAVEPPVKACETRILLWEHQHYFQRYVRTRRVVEPEIRTIIRLMGRFMSKLMNDACLRWQCPRRSNDSGENYAPCLHVKSPVLTPIYHHKYSNQPKA